MDDETGDDNYLIKQARKYHEVADNDDGHRRRILLGVALDLEVEARNLKRQSEQPKSGTD